MSTTGHVGGSRVKRLHALVFQRRWRNKTEYFLNDSDFRFAADCERMRVDRNHSTLSLLLIELAERSAAEADVAFLERVLEGRLRVTDTPGLLSDGRVGVLLPDTAEEGAWKVAADVSEVYPPGPERPRCEVLVYPDPHQRYEHEEAKEGSQARDGVMTSGDERPNRDEDRLSSDAFFAEATPAWKRLFDICGALVGLVAAAPVLVVAAAAIKVSSPGPVFFWQEREGRGGKRFQMAKLRTMRVDAEQQQHELRHKSHQDGPAFKLRRDPRTTRVGRLLRATSMDELPQFWNVLTGDMSLVGPRPLPTDESRSCLGWQRRRLNVAPGMTCTWQVTSRGSVLFDAWVRMDLRYAKKRTLWTDLKLVLATVPSLISNRGMR